VRALALELDATDARLIDAAALDNERFERRRWDGELVIVERLTVLAQAVHHATEHRAQLLAYLDMAAQHMVNAEF
jgi:truncated hemoglobin YjbI